MNIQQAAEREYPVYETGEFLNDEEIDHAISLDRQRAAFIKGYEYAQANKNEQMENNQSVPPGIIAFNLHGNIYTLKDCNYPGSNEDIDYEEWAEANLYKPPIAAIHTIEVNGQQFSVGEKYYEPTYKEECEVESFHWIADSWTARFTNKGWWPVERLSKLPSPTPVEPVKAGGEEKKWTDTDMENEYNLRRAIVKRDTDVIVAKYCENLVELNALKAEIALLKQPQAGEEWESREEIFKRWGKDSDDWRIRMDEKNEEITKLEAEITLLKQTPGGPSDEEIHKGFANTVERGWDKFDYEVWAKAITWYKSQLKK